MKSEKPEVLAEIYHENVLGKGMSAERLEVKGLLNETTIQRALKRQGGLGIGAIAKVYVIKNGEKKYILTAAPYLSTSFNAYTGQKTQRASGRNFRFIYDEKLGVKDLF